MELSFVARACRVLVGMAAFAVFLVDKAEDRLTHISSSLPNRLASIESAQTVALLSRFFAVAELAQPLLVFAFAATTIGMTLAIAAGARRQRSITLVCLGAAVPALLYQVASKFMGQGGQG